MTRDVLISIKGLHTVRDAEGNSDDSVEMFSPGKYYFRNGKHYVEYEEPEDDGIPEEDEQSETGRTQETAETSATSRTQETAEASGTGRTQETAEASATGRRGVIRTRVTLRGRRLEVIRKGIVNTKMVFEEGVKNTCWYDTVAGSLLMGIDVNRMQITESKDLIEILVDYALEANYEHLTDNSIRIRIMAKDSGLFHLM